MRRRAITLFAVLLLSMAIGSRETSAAGRDCSFTNCGAKCIVFGPFAGFCNPPAADSPGCIQLWGPDCASLHNAYCCVNQGAGAF